jgi:hypothetical protein
MQVNDLYRPGKLKDDFIFRYCSTFKENSRLRTVVGNFSVSGIFFTFPRFFLIFRFFPILRFFLCLRFFFVFFGNFFDFLFFFLNIFPGRTGKEKKKQESQARQGTRQGKTIMFHIKPP